MNQDDNFVFAGPPPWSGGPGGPPWSGGPDIPPWAGGPGSPPWTGNPVDPDTPNAVVPEPSSIIIFGLVFLFALLYIIRKNHAVKSG